MRETEKQRQATVDGARHGGEVGPGLHDPRPAMMQSMEMSGQVFDPALLGAAWSDPGEAQSLEVRASVESAPTSEHVAEPSRGGGQPEGRSGPQGSGPLGAGGLGQGEGEGHQANAPPPEGGEQETGPAEGAEGGDPAGEADAPTGDAPPSAPPEGPPDGLGPAAGAAAPPGGPAATGDRSPALVAPGVASTPAEVSAVSAAAGGPSAAPPAATPTVGDMIAPTYTVPTLDEAEQARIAEQTGRTPAEHAAAIQGDLDAIQQQAGAHQRQSVDQADARAAEAESALDGRIVEVGGVVSDAGARLGDAYGQARTAVSQAAGAACGQVEADAASAESAIATSAERNATQAKADYDAYGEQVEGLVTEWQPTFQTLFDDAGKACVEVAAQKADELAGKGPAVAEFFKGGGDALQTYLGGVRTAIAQQKLPEAAAAMRAGGPAQQATMSTEGEGFAPKVRETLQPVSDKASQVGTDAQAAVEQARTSAEGRLAGERHSVGTEIDGAEQGALDTLTADEAAAREEVTAIGRRIEADIATRKEDTRNRFTELSAGLAERYRAFVEGLGDALPAGGEFLPHDAVEPALAARREALVAMHQAVLGEVDEAHQTALEEMNRSVDGELQALDEVVRGAGDEARRLAQAKVEALGESAARFGAGMVEIGGSIDEAMVNYTAPTKASLEQHRASCLTELETLKGTTKTNLDARVTQYGSDLTAQIDDFCPRIQPAVFDAAREKEIALEGRAKRAYSAMRGMGTDEDAVFDALRGLQPGEPGALRFIFARIAGGSLDGWLRDDLDDDEYAIARAHLALDHGAAARLEIADNVNWYGDDEAQIEKILRGLPEEERARIADNSAWDGTRTLLSDNLDGTDLDVTDALMANKVHRADALRLRETIDKARREGDHDAVHAALEGISPADMEKVAQEFAHIQGDVDLDAGESIDVDAAKSALVEYTTEEKTIGYDPNTGQPIEQSMEGANADLVGALVHHGAGSMQARVARIEVENTRTGGPKDENLEKVLYSSPEIQEALHSGDPERVAAAQQQVEAERAELTRLYGETYGRPGEDPSQALSQTLATIGDDEGKRALYQQMLTDGYNSPEVARQQIQLAVEGAGTDEEAIKRALTGMHPDEIAELKRIYPDLEEDLGTNGHGGFFTELSGEDRMEVELALLGDEKWMNDAQRFELAQKKYDWQRGSESTDLGRWLMDGTIEAEQLDTHFAALEGYQARIVDGRFQGTPEEYEEYRRTCRYVGITAALYQEQSDRVANAVTTTLAVTGAVVAAGLTGGAASPLVVMAVTAGTGAASMGANYTMKGGRYGWENAAKDLGVTAVNTLTAGGVARFGANAVAAGNTVTVGQKAMLGAGAGFVNSSAATAMEDATWRDGFTTGLGRTTWSGIKGGAVGGGTAWASNAFEATALGNKLVNSTSVLVRGTGKAISGAAGGFAGSNIDVAMDALAGDYKGTDLSGWGQKVATETLKGAGQGFLEGMAEVPKARQTQQRAEHEALARALADEEAARQEASRQVEAAEDDAAGTLEASDRTAAGVVDDTVERLNAPVDDADGPAPDGTRDGTPDPALDDTGPQGKGPQQVFEETLAGVKQDTDATKQAVVDETTQAITDADETLQQKTSDIEADLESTRQQIAEQDVDAPDAEVETEGSTASRAPDIDAGEASAEAATPVRLDPAQEEIAVGASRLQDDVLDRLIALERAQNGNPVVTDMILKIAVDDIAEASRVLTLLEEYTVVISKDPRQMSVAEMETVLKAHYHLDQHASQAFLRKVIPEAAVIEHINRRYRTLGGSVGDPQNTEGLTAAEKVEVLGLDYDDTSYVQPNGSGGFDPVDELFFMDSDFSDGMKGAARIPVDEALHVFAQTSTDPEIMALLPKLMRRDATYDETPLGAVRDTTDPYTGTGGTAPGDRLSGGLVRTNQERMIPTGGGYFGEPYGTGTQIKYQAPDGTVIVVATFIELPGRSIVQLNPDLPADLRARFADKFDPDIVGGAP